MDSDPLGIANPQLLSSLRKQRQKGSKIHKFNQADGESSFSCNPASREGEVYLTSQGRNIKLGDHIVLNNDLDFVRYEVRKIEYYAEPPDMWMALLRKVDLE